MLNSVVAALLLASSASRVAAGPVESRHMRIARGYAQDADILEDYTPYHVRYLALDCQDKHNTTFFDKCCHPLLRWQKLSDRPKECTPSPSASASAVLAEPTAPVIDEDPIDDDCDADEDPEEECDDDTTTSAAPTLTYGAVTSTSRAQSHTPEPTSTKQAPTEAPTTTQPISTSRMITRTTRSAEPTTSADPTTYADPTTSAKPTTSAAPDNGGNNDGGKVITGGVATWFTQNSGTGACGAKHSDSDHIVAMAIGMYGDENARSKYCGKKVLITNTDNGKSVEAIIADCCPTCPKPGSLDLSTSAFAAIGDLNTGVLPIKYTLFD